MRLLAGARRLGSMMLALGVAGVMAVAIPAAIGVVLGPDPPPEELPSALNVLLAGLFPSWDLVGQLDARRRSQRRLSVLRSAAAGMVCVLVTLLASIVLEGALMLSWHGELRVRFAYTALIPGLYVFVATAPVGVAVGVLSDLVLRVERVI